MVPSGVSLQIDSQWPCERTSSGSTDEPTEYCGTVYAQQVRTTVRTAAAGRASKHLVGCEKPGTPARKLSSWERAKVGSQRRRPDYEHPHGHNIPSPTTPCPLPQGHPPRRPPHHQPPGRPYALLSMASLTAACRLSARLARSKLPHEAASVRGPYHHHHHHGSFSSPLVPAGPSQSSA